MDESAQFRRLISELQAVSRELMDRNRRAIGEVACLRAIVQTLLATSAQQQSDPSHFVMAATESIRIALQHADSDIEHKISFAAFEDMLNAIQNGALDQLKQRP